MTIIPPISVAKREVLHKFRAANIETPELDVRLLLTAATGFDAADIISRSHDRMAPDAYTQFLAMADRRLQGEPVDHILGYREFYGRQFDINADVLSPRPETEGLVTAVLEQMKRPGPFRVLDLGTGSGAILVSVLSEWPQAIGVAVDMSPAALKIAHANASRHNVIERCEF